MTMKEDCIYIKTFSGFEMKMNDKVLSDESIRSNMMLKLLVYILCYRKNTISASEISEILWKEDESDNPIGALKNLMYRLRTVLNQTFGRNDFIKTLRGSYAWNNEIEVILDVEEFEKCYRNAKSEENHDLKKQTLIKAVSLYTGVFLPKFSSEHWILQLSTYYQSLYVTCIKELATLYEEAEAYEKMEVLCNEALKHEELDENIHCMLMKALLYQGKKAMAEEHYKITSDMLYSQLGTRPSEEMQELYKIILKEIKNKQMDLMLIQQDLKEVKKERGAYLCEYGVFKAFYALQARQAKRMGIAVYCGLITIESTFNLPVNSEAYRRFKDTTMESLENTILSTLRAGDVVAKYSATQFIIMLPICNYEGGLIALNRVENNFKHIAEKYHARLICDIKELELD